MLTVAVGQVEPVFGDVAGNVQRTAEVVARAAAQGVQVLVLPELVSSGYMFASREEAFALAETAGSGPATSEWLRLAAAHDMIIVAGFPESDGARLYNAAFMAHPDGTYAVYRKVHLWDEEALYFEPGDLGFPVVATPHGRLGMLICYDGWFPEAYRTLALKGADLVCVPTNWVPIPGQQPGQPAMATVLSMGAAHSNGIVVAAADRVGTERGQEFIGQSLIASHTGWPVAGPAGSAGEDLLVAQVDLAEARRSRSWGRFNNPVRDRRPESYEIA